MPKESTAVRKTKVENLKGKYSEHAKALEVKYTKHLPAENLRRQPRL